jgi:hypothetical protein
MIQGISFFRFDAYHISEIIVYKAPICGCVIKVEIIVYVDIEIIEVVTRVFTIEHPDTGFYSRYINILT